MIKLQIPKILSSIEERFIDAIKGAILLGTAALLFQIAFWLVFPYKTAEVVEPMEVLNENKELTPNELLQLKFTFTKYTDISPTVSRNVLCSDGTTHFVAVQASTGNSRPTGTFTANSKYGLSESMPTDVTCFFQFTNEYDVNPIRTITKVWRSESFTIVEESSNEKTN